MRYLFFAIALFIATFCVTFFGIKAIRSAVAHTAIPTAAQPQGWDYPASCCSGTDCAEIKTDRVEETPEGYRVTLRPEDHIMVARETVFMIKYNDPKIKDSPDGVFHICLSRQQVLPGNVVHGGNLYCFFIPPKGY
jgi:hypothetical protein